MSTKGRHSTTAKSRIVGAKPACMDDCGEIVSLMDGKHMCKVIYLTMSHLLIESKAHTINSSASIALKKALGQFERATRERKNSPQLTIHKYLEAFCSLYHKNSKNSNFSLVSSISGEIRRGYKMK